MVGLHLITKGNRKSFLILEIVAVAVGKKNSNLLISLYFELLIIGFGCINMLFAWGLFSQKNMYS